jgi:acetoin utilization protein AcuB
MSTLIRDIMIQHPVTLREPQSLFSARELMAIHQYECLFVVDEKSRPIGILSSFNVVDDPKKASVVDFMRREFPRLRPEDTIQTAARTMVEEKSQNLAMAVVGDEGELVGVVRIRDIVKDLTEPNEPEGALTAEMAAMYLAMSRTEAKERTWIQRIRDAGMRPAVTQVGATAEKLPIKLRESSIVAAIAYRVIHEDDREKTAVSRALGEIILQMRTISPGLGGGYKIGLVRGKGLIAVAAFGRSGHALANSPEQAYMGTSVL